MLRSTTLLPIALVAALSACSQSAPTAGAITRADTMPIGFQSTNTSSSVLQSQADGLTQMANGIVRASTAKGAMFGAALGCGISVIAAGSVDKCVTGALVSGASGAITGNRAGKKDVARRVEIADPNALVRSIRRSNDGLVTLNETLPAHLAAQDAELRALKAGLADGSVSQARYDQKVDAIRQNRAKLAEALTLAAHQSRTAVANLENAAAQGQTGLEWHILATSKLEENTISARSSIKLL